jgi:hypothetical protein
MLARHPMRALAMATQITAWYAAVRIQMVQIKFGPRPGNDF